MTIIPSRPPGFSLSQIFSIGNIVPRTVKHNIITALGSNYYSRENGYFIRDCKAVVMISNEIIMLDLGIKLFDFCNVF